MNISANAILERHNRLLAELQGSRRLDIPIDGARPLVVVDKKITTSDIPTRTLVVDGEGAPLAVLFISTPDDVAYVARSLDTAAQAKRALGAQLGSVILDPIAQGETGGCSFAMWPWHRTLTAVRGFAFVQRLRLLPHVLAWLRDATERTAGEARDDEVAARFKEPLARMARDGRLPAPSQSLAQSGLQRLESGAWRPRVALQHKDILWNLLLPRDRASRAQFPCGFILIDWASGTLRGSPFINLLELARNSRMRAGVVRAELMRHCRILQCEPRDIMSYALASVGFTLAHLGNFPEDQYRALYRNHLLYWLDAVGNVASIQAQ
jgi:hypothetical protein